MKKFIIIALLILPLSGFAQTASKDPDYQDKPEEKYDMLKKEIPPDIEVDNLKAKETIKTEKTLCIKDNCKDSWPTLKCAEFDSRPAGESGETFCQGINKTCFAVFIGSGTGYFNECSTTPNSVHKTRCCWVE